MNGGRGISRLRAACLAGYAASTFLAFPHPLPPALGGGVLDLGALLGWLPPGLLALGVAGRTPRRAARDAFVASLAAHAGVLHWIYVVTVTYGHAPPWLGVLAPVGLAAYVAAFAAAFAGGLRWLEDRGTGGALSGAALWTALDLGRTVVLGGFPWALLGYAHHRNPALLGLAPVLGVYGLSFAAALPGLVAARAALRPPGRRGGALGGALLAVAGAHALGAGLGVGMFPAERAAPGDRTLRVGVVQGNVDQGVKWSPDRAREILLRYEDLSRQAAARGARLIAWPETAVPGSPDTDPGLEARLVDLARETGALLVVGAVGIEADGGRARYFDSAYVYSARGRIALRYDKAKLVPFGEYVPLQAWLGRLFRAVARGIAPESVTAGPAPRSLALRDPALPGGGVTVGTPICYELVFPGVVRGFAADGAELLVALTNDAWYGRTGAPYQFLAITALRAAENRIWIARAANTGVSAIIDAAGRVRQRTPIFETGVLVADVPLRSPEVSPTPYARFGDLFAGACALGVAAAAFRGRRVGAGLREGAGAAGARRRARREES